MNRILSGFAAIAVGIGLLAGAAPTTAEAGSVVNKLRDRGLGKWVDRYVQEDSNGKVTYKSQDKKADAPKANTVSSAKKKLTTKKKTSKNLKTASNRKSTKKLATKTSKKKAATRKLTKKKSTKKKYKKIAKKTPAKKLSSKSGKNYKVPTRVKNRLASYGINF